MKSIAVCILTYRRPIGLCRLMRGLASLEPLDAETWDGEIVVVDNDPDASARELVDQNRGLFAWPLTYLVETQPGIAHARNAALDHARPRHDAIAFIDDDETPDPLWLRELLRVQAQYCADVVSGPVEPRFEQVPPRWIIDGRFFCRRRLTTGTRLRFVASGNLLLLSEAISDNRFEERLSMVGGEDTLLSMHLIAAGRSMVWADDAVVFEWNPPERTTFRWLTRRGFQQGSSMVAVERCFGVGPWRRIVRLAKGIGLLTGAAVTLPLALFLGRSALGRTLMLGARGAGTIAGLVGVRFAAYGRQAAQDQPP